jgi:two-component system sensor histidine kinase/response regulator
MEYQFLDETETFESRGQTKQRNLFGPKPLEYIVILIVADTTGNLGLLFDYLRGFGFRVIGVNDGENALSILEYVKPDIILLDVKLPGIDGFETCRRLKGKDATRNIPVIFITDQTNTVHKVRGFTLGAVDYITKPIQSEEVVVRLKTHLTIQSLQMRLAEQNARLQVENLEKERLIKELDAFAHTVAHDLKNPVGVTISYAQFLQKYIHKLPPHELNQFTDNIMWNGYKMSNIIDELLLLSSIRKEDVRPVPLDMGQIVEDAQNRLTHLLKEEQAELIVPDPAVWPAALGYSPWVEEVWTNYISNAIKYGGQPPRIELGAAVQADMVKFWVKDNGDGLTPKEQKSLFIPFTRLGQVSTEGHGLGLSIVQRIVTKLGGEVGVESEGVPGQGSVFSFYLPQAVGGSFSSDQKG